MDAPLSCPVENAGHTLHQFAHRTLTGLLPAASILASGTLNPRCEGLQHLKTITHPHETASGRAGVTPCLHEVEA